MDLAGQGAPGRPRPGRTRLDDDGYILAVLLIGMAIAAVWLGAAIPAWKQQATRQRELDLIFRGEQYARAVAMYTIQNNCALPTNVDDLVSRKYLRKKWNDPITSADFVLIPGAQPGQASSPGGAGAPGRAGTPGGAGQPGRAGATPTTPTAPTTPTTGGGQTPGRAGTPSTGTSGTSGFGGQSGSQSLAGGGIAGVMSKSTDASIIVYNGQQTYSGWTFTYQAQLQKMGQSCGGQGQPGAGGGTGGRGNQPGNGRGGPGVGGPGGGPGGPPPPGGGRGPGQAGGRDGGPPPTGGVGAGIGRGRGRF